MLAAAGSAIGLGNLWRFPYLAAKNGGGLFLAVYLALLVTFGFTLLVTGVAIGRKTISSPLMAYGKLHEKWKWIGVFAVVVPFLILPYYCVIGGWVLKYCVVFLTGQVAAASENGFFSGYITSTAEPLVFMALYLFLTFFVVYREIDDGIEKFSKLLMPVLLLIVIGVALFSLTIRYDDGTVTRTGMDGLAVYLIPNLDGLTAGGFMSVLLAAMGQLFFSISVAMGIMITYGSYFKDRGNIFSSVWQIGIFDTAVAILAGLMTVVPIYVLMGQEGMNASGPSLLFVAMPKTFHSMGFTGTVVGAAFFISVSASRPSMPGMRTSMTTTSNLGPEPSHMALTALTPSRPLEATSTSMERRPRRFFMMSRNSVSSSTIRTCMGTSLVLAEQGKRGNRGLPWTWHGAGEKQEKGKGMQLRQGPACSGKL